MRDSRRHLLDLQEDYRYRKTRYFNEKKKETEAILIVVCIKLFF